MGSRVNEGKEVTSVGIESGAMEGDSRLVGGREEEEGDCQKEGLQRGSRGSSGAAGALAGDFSQFVAARSPSLK